jgi:hypothetical protein
VLDLLCHCEMLPARRQIGDTRLYGNAMMLPSASRTPYLRARLSGEPAIGGVCGWFKQLRRAGMSRVLGWGAMICLCVSG